MGLPAFEFQSNFTAWDWGIVAAFLAATVVIGVYAKRHVANLTDFLVAGRQLKPELGVTTMVATELGLVTVMVSAQRGFTHGFAAFHIGLAAGAAVLFVGLTGFVVVPLRRMGVMTIPEFYGRRFGRGVRVLGGAVLALAGILKMGLFLQVGALFLAGLTGLTDPIAVKWIMTGLLALVLLYTVLGGMVSVIVTDYLQFIALSLALLLACALGLASLAIETKQGVLTGMDAVVSHLQDVRGEKYLNPFHRDGFGPEHVAWVAVLALMSAAAWPPIVMRACAARDTRAVRQIYSFSSVGVLVGAVIPSFLGAVALVYFCADSTMLRDLALKGQFVPDASGRTALLALPVALSQFVPVGLIGLVAAGMVAAFMSTQDSYLLCWGAVLTQDVLAPCLRRDLSDKARLRVTRVLILLIGGFLLVAGLWWPLSRSLWDYLAVAGAVYFTGAFWLLVLGLYWRRASRFGAYLALVCGAAALLGLEPVRNALRLPISGAAAALGAVALSMAAMVLGSVLVPDRGSSRDERR